MGFIHKRYGRITIETRTESFIVHTNYGYDESGNMHSDDLGTFGINWRENGHPEFLLADLPDLVEALSAVSGAGTQPTPEPEEAR